MEGWVFIVLLIIAAPLALAVWLIVRATDARNRIETLSRRIDFLEIELSKLKSGGVSLVERLATKPTPTPKPEPEPEPEAQPYFAPAPVTTAEPEPFSPVAPTSIPPLAPVFAETASATPPPLLASASAQSEPEPLPAPETASVLPAINWEQFMGVKLFAWIGGLALFLGVAFFVKYSFDNNLVSPELRVAIGFIAGLGLLVGGVVLSRKDYRVLAHTLCATGVVILYAVTFSCRSIYHFEFFGLFPTFALMVLITSTAFLLSVRMDAMAVAILGMLGGFLTPVLLSSGQDNPGGLFGYIAILDIGLILVALNRRWTFLTVLAAIGTVAMQAGWAEKFFTEGKYFEGNKILIPFVVLAGFSAVFLAASVVAKRRGQLDWWLSGSTLGLCGTALGFVAWFLTFAPLAHRPWLMFGFVFLIDLIIAALILTEEATAVAQPIAGLAVFLLLAGWTAESLTNDFLNAALVCYFVFALFHAVFPIVLQRLRGSSRILLASQIFPSLALLLVLVPVFRFADVSFAVWPFVLLVDVLAISLAVLTASLLSVLVVLVLTLAATAALIFKIPATLTGLPTSLFVIGAFAVFFMAAGVWLARRFNPDALKAGIKLSENFALPANLAAQLPSVSGVLPFLLLIMVTERLPLANPSPVFGLALLLLILLLGITKYFSIDWMPAIALGCVIALEFNWHFNHFEAAKATVPLLWYLLFMACVAVFPFLFLKTFSNKTPPWAAAALASPAHFLIVYRLVQQAHPNAMMGLLPAAFAVIPLLSLGIILKAVPATVPNRMAQLAWFGGTGLFFITLIFPIQFERQWITLGWALEGAALLWLYHRVTHNGLRIVGVGLLAAAFVRLTFNPAVLEYHPRAATPILNWYLYAYGITAVCLFMGARLMAPPRNRVLNINAPPILTALGTILAFVLLNIEIADYFSATGSTLTFQFSGNFARDMTYSIAWALFALTLLVFGIIKKAPASRYSGLGLLSITILKLFFHDLAHLPQLYRIGALIGVAVIAMLASLAYQRFFSSAAKETPAPNEAVPK